MIGIEPRRREIGFRPALDRDHREAVRIEMAAQRGQEILWVDPDDEADLTRRFGPRWDRVDRVLRVPGREGQHLEAAPAEHLLGGRKIVGRSGARRGPSEAISTSARSRSWYMRHTSRSPGDPISSPVSIRNTELKPSRPRICNTQSSAAMLIVC